MDNVIINDIKKWDVYRKKRQRSKREMGSKKANILSNTFWPFYKDFSASINRIKKSFIFVKLCFLSDVKG